MCSKTYYTGRVDVLRLMCTFFGCRYYVVVGIYMNIVFNASRLLCPSMSVCKCASVLKKPHLYAMVI